ncbi:serine/threonine-protein kinase [Streptomyces sp. NPDC006879]|uniref:serine/threonine-protein kinase n=1 Tax=Streptomyces sp. NPDC006879 TaxID=3364767 RepID=UPI00369D384C
MLLARRYRLERVLGRGGMGTVWRALDETLGRTVAVKELRFPTGIDEDEKRRLITRTLREAKAIARIRSGGAVTVFDVVDVDDRPWIVMELIEGASLAEVIRERGTLTPRRAAEVGLAVLDVLRAAHLEGILHRDVKPSNVLIADTGRVVLTDFGIAQVEGDPSVTSTGMLVGAPSYISPERARGQKPGPPADMWSLGGLLYASVEGVPPYDKGSALATLTAVMTDPVDPPKNAGPLADVIYGLLAKDPDQRLDEAGARAMLTAVLDAPEAEPPADRTRVVELPPVPSEPVRDPKAEKAQKAARDAAAKAARDAAKEAAREAVKAAKAAKEKERQERARAAARPAVATGAAAPAGPKRPVPAPLTDVMPRRTIVLALAAFLAVLVVIGSLVVYAFSGDDEPGVQNKDKRPAAGSSSPAPADGQDGKNGDAPAGQGGADPGAAAQGSAAGGADGQEGGQGGAAGTGSDPKGSAAQGVTTDTGTTTTAEGGTAGGSVPAGYATVTDTRFHFTMAMPEGFRRTKIAGSNSGGIYSRDGGFPRVQVDYNASPTDDAALAWNQLEPAIARSSTAYRLIGITKTSYNGYPTVADWQFERTQGGVAVRVLNRGFKVDATHGYAIMISCKASEWDGAECRSLRETAFATFQPKD